MPLVSLLLLWLAPASSPVPPLAPEALSSDPASSLVWDASGVVASDGALRLLPGWHVRVGLDGRAHLLGPTPRASQRAGQWDDEAIARGVRVVVRVTARDGESVYVEGRLSEAARSRSFLLRWDAATGVWSEASARV